MLIAGLDYSTHSLDVVCLNIDDNHAEWEHVNFPGTSALERARSVRDQLPARQAWADNGVILIAIEQPMSRFPQGLVPLMRTLGAIHACLPSSVEVWEMTATEWRRELGLKTTAKRDMAKAEAARFALDHWPNMPADVTGDACDAFCIAYAARRINQRAFEAAA